MEFVNDLRLVYIDKAGKCHEADDMIAFLSWCPNLERRKHSRLLSEMCCLCLLHSRVCIAYVGLGSGKRREWTADLTSKTFSFQWYSISASQVCGFIADPPLIAACTALLDDFGDSALVSSYGFLWILFSVNRSLQILQNGTKLFDPARAIMSQLLCQVLLYPLICLNEIQKQLKDQKRNKQDIESSGSENLILKKKKPSDGADCSHDWMYRIDWIVYLHLKHS